MKNAKHILILILFASFTLAPFGTLAQTAQDNFYVASERDAAGRSVVSASLRHTSAQAYFYTEDTYHNSLTEDQKDTFSQKLSALGTEFDDNIYPKLRAAYGSEWTPGIDNETRITVLITPMDSGTGGYVLTRNEQPAAIEPKSNEREMVYLNSDYILEDLAKSHLAHEFVHLIEYNQKRRSHGVAEEVWLSEALAEYAPTLLGYNSPYEGSYLENRISDFLSVPSNSLTGWRGRSVDFGSASAFMHFAVSHYGDDILGGIMQSPRTGEPAVESAIGNTTFKDLFARWHTANYINGPVESSRGHYAYKNAQLGFSNLHVSPSVRYSLFLNSRVSTNFRVEYAGAAWIKFTPGQLGNTSKNVLEIDFDASGDTGSFSVPLVVTKLSGPPRVEFIELQNEKGGAYIENFGTDIVSVVAIPTNYYPDNSNNNPSGGFTINVQLVEEAPGESPSDTTSPEESGKVKGVDTLADGTLVRAQGDDKVYVIKKAQDGTTTRRWIPSPEIFNGYGHLRWEDIVVVEPENLEDVEISHLIKFIGDYRVYELNEAGDTKQHLNITPAQFEQTGRSWSAIYEVNKNEYDFYSTGTPITMQ